MNSSEQSHRQESREGLESAIHIMREAAERFQALDDEAPLLLVGRDAAGYIEKLKEKASILIDLPNRLINSLEGVEQETRQRILLQVSHFAAMAREGIESGGSFGLAVLLTHPGGAKGDKNDLEKLIESLEE